MIYSGKGTNTSQYDSSCKVLGVLFLLSLVEGDWSQEVGTVFQRQGSVEVPQEVEGFR